MAQQSLSPLVQESTTPLAVFSHLQMPMVRLQQQTIIPFIIMQQEHMPPAIIVQRFCTIAAAVLSSHEQTIRMPPWHFSILMVQCGTIIGLISGVVPGIGVPMPAGRAMPMLVAIEVIIPVAMTGLLSPSLKFPPGRRPAVDRVGKAWSCSD
jgi:hypothetical protein